MDRKLKPMAEAIEKMVGTQAAGFILAGIADALNNVAQGTDRFEIRSMKLTINGFFETDLMPKAK